MSTATPTLNNCDAEEIYRIGEVVRSNATSLRRTCRCPGSMSLTEYPDRILWNLKVRSPCSGMSLSG